MNIMYLYSASSLLLKVQYVKFLDVNIQNK